MSVKYHLHEDIFTDLERAVPASRAERHAVGANAQATHTILVPCENTDTLAFQRVPHVARPIIVTTK